MVTGDERKERVLRQRMEVAQAMVGSGRAERVLVQDSQVYVQQGVCAGCSKVGPWLVDKTDAWCPSCGGRALVHLDQADVGEFENGLCRMGTSPVIHLVAPPIGEHPLCMPNALVGRMKPATNATDPTCGRCIAADAGKRQGRARKPRQSRQKEQTR